MPCGPDVGWSRWSGSFWVRGSGGLTQEIRIEASIPYGEIPHFPLSTVESHEGRLLLGTLAGNPGRGHAGKVPPL